MEIEERWKEIFGEAMPPDVLNRILKIQKIMGIKDDDGIWQVIIPLEYYQRLHEQLPSSMRAESEVITRQVKEASGSVIRAAAEEVQKGQKLALLEIKKAQEEAKGDVARALGPTLETEIRKTISKLSTKKWLYIGLAVGAVVMVLAIAGAYSVGAQNGPLFGPMAQSWSGFKNCDGAGWKKELLQDGHTYCFPHPAADGVHGWRIP